jgi:hypothetical protein
MTISTPKAMPKHELRKDIANYEKRYTNKTNTLSQFFSQHVLGTWDLAELNPAQLLLLHETIAKKPRNSLIVIELKKV